MSDVNPVDAASGVIDLDKQPHDRGDVDLLYRIYMEKRIASQIGFYESRMKENQLNADFTFTAGALVMTLSSLIATISASAGAPSYLSLLSAILPAFAALLGAFRQIYGWERQINIYRDSLLGLEKVKLAAPDDDRIAVSDLPNIYPELVSSSETVFTGEVNQWGQFILDKDKGSGSSDQAMTALIGELDLTDEQRSVIAAVLSSGKGKTATSTNLLASVSTSTTVTASTTTNPNTNPAEAGPGTIELNASRSVEALVAETPAAETTPPEEKPETPTKSKSRTPKTRGVG